MLVWLLRLLAKIQGPKSTAAWLVRGIDGKLLPSDPGSPDHKAWANREGRFEG